MRRFTDSRPPRCLARPCRLRRAPRRPLACPPRRSARLPSRRLRGAAASAYWVAASSARASTSPQSAARADAFARASLVGTPLVSRRAFSGGYFNNNYRPPPLRRPPPASPSHDGEQMLWNIIGANTLIFAGWHAFDPRVMHANFAVSEESIYRGRVHTAVTAAVQPLRFRTLRVEHDRPVLFRTKHRASDGAEVPPEPVPRGGVAASIAHVAWCRRERNARRRRLRGRTDGTILQSAGRRWARGGGSSEYLRTPPALGASGAVNAIVLLNAALFPFQTVYLNFFVPMPTALFAAMFLARDLYGAQMGLGGIEHGTRRASRRRRRRRRGVGCDAIRSVSTGRGYRAPRRVFRMTTTKKSQSRDEATLSQSVARRACKGHTRVSPVARRACKGHTRVSPVARRARVKATLESVP